MLLRGFCALGLHRVDASFLSLFLSFFLSLSLALSLWGAFGLFWFSFGRSVLLGRVAGGLFVCSFFGEEVKK